MKSKRRLCGHTLSLDEIEFEFDVILVKVKRC